MILLSVDPKRVYGFHQHENRGRELLEHVLKNGWNGIPPIPVFEIPLDFANREHDYTLIDGNNRRNVAEHLKQQIRVAIYQPDEVIDAERDGLAHSRNLINPNRYALSLGVYVLRKQLSNNIPPIS